MTHADFQPVLYLRKGCPFCMKVRIFLSEAGMHDRVSIREFAPGTDEEGAIRSELTGHFEKVAFPTAQIEPGRYLNDSDGIIARLVDLSQSRIERMPTLRSYTEDFMPAVMALYGENAELTKKAAS